MLFIENHISKLEKQLSKVSQNFEEEIKLITSKLDKFKTLLPYADHYIIGSASPRGYRGECLYFIVDKRKKLTLEEYSWVVSFCGGSLYRPFQHSLDDNANTIIDSGQASIIDLGVAFEAIKSANFNSKGIDTSSWTIEKFLEMGGIDRAYSVGAGLPIFLAKELVRNEVKYASYLSSDFREVENTHEPFYILKETDGWGDRKQGFLARGNVMSFHSRDSLVQIDGYWTISNNVPGSFITHANLDRLIKENLFSVPYRVQTIPENVFAFRPNKFSGEVNIKMRSTLPAYYEMRQYTELLNLNNIREVM